MAKHVGPCTSLMHSFTSFRNQTSSFIIYVSFLFLEKETTVKDVLNHVTEGVSRPFKVLEVLNFKNLGSSYTCQS